ncbi:TLR4 protein, partial [Amia calva]|nr:TLR4 protein [Amia calva]
QTVPDVSLSCMGLNLSRIPADIPPTVQTLDFSFNRLEALRNNSFPLLPDLTELDLTRCHIRFIGSNSFEKMKNLTTLILTGNPIEQYESEAFSSLQRLQRLVVVDTNLSSLENLPLIPLTHLQELNAGTNNIEFFQIPPYVFNFTNFRLLDLHCNKIAFIAVSDTIALRETPNKNLTLILSRNQISHIEPGAFQGIHLKELHLRTAFVLSGAIKSCLKAMAGLTVDKLIIGNYRGANKIQTSEVDFLDGLCLFEFQEIYLLLKESTARGGDIFQCLTNASKISVVSSHLQQVKVPQFRRLKELQLKKNDFSYIPAAELSYQSTIETLKITDNKPQTYFYKPFIEMTALKYLEISRSHLSIQECCSKQFSYLPQLKYLNLSFNSELRLEGTAFTGLEQLETLDLQHTKVTQIGVLSSLSNLRNLKYLDICYTNTDFFVEHALSGLISLKVLRVSGNVFRGNTSTYLFRVLQNLEELDISNCGLGHLHPSTFTGLDKLKHLTVTNNKIREVEFLTHPSLGALKTIHIGTNNIITIPQHTLDRLPKNLTALDLSQNPIECTCAYAGFIKWTIENKAKLTDQNRILCQGPVDSRNTKVTEFDVNYCRHMSTIIITLTLGVVLLIFLLTLFVYKYQFYIRYACILLRGYRSTKMGECAYDAFVIYSSRDELWVMDELVENLENGVPPLQLCLHVRDFEVGKSITSNIIDEGILNSRKAIVVISQYFIESAWCKFEFEMAQSWLFLEGNLGIIVIILEDVEDDKMNRVLGLHKYVKNNTYLKWKKNPLSSMRFWTRLRKAVMSGKNTA